MYEQEFNRFSMISLTEFSQLATPDCFQSGVGNVTSSHKEVTCRSRARVALLCSIEVIK